MKLKKKSGAYRVWSRDYTDKRKKHKDVQGRLRLKRLKRQKMLKG